MSLSIQKWLNATLQAHAALRRRLGARCVFMPLRRALGATALVVVTALSHSTRAEQVEGLHQGVVSVADHGQAALQSGTRAALEQVLLKVSGHPSVLDNERLTDALQDATRYMQRYRYVRDDDALSLEVDFDPASVNALLRENGSPLWTSNRPAVLVWLVLEDANGRRLATPDSDPGVFSALQNAMVRRGVPQAYPLYDLADLQAAGLDALWRLDELTVYRASRRYGNDNVVVGRFKALPDGSWLGDWTYLYRQDSSSGSLYRQDTQAVADRIANFVADRMAPRYAVAAGDGERSLLVRVDSVQSFDDYSVLLETFMDVEFVSRAWLAYFDSRRTPGGPSAVFRLTAQADADSLERVLALDRRLQRNTQPSPLPRGPLGIELSYRWLP